MPGLFPLLAIGAVVNFRVHELGSIPVFSSFGYIPRSGFCIFKRYHWFLCEEKIVGSQGQSWEGRKEAIVIVWVSNNADLAEGYSSRDGKMDLGCTGVPALPGLTAGDGVGGRRLAQGNSP